MPWFIAKINDPTQIKVKEEISIALILASLNQIKIDDVDQTLLLEVLDIVSRIIEWKGGQQVYNATINLYLIFMNNLLNKMELRQMNQQIKDLISRVNSKELDLEFKLKIVRIFMIQNLEGVQFNLLLSEIRSFLFQQQFLQGSRLDGYISNLLLIIRILHQMQNTLPDFNNQIYDLLLDYQDYIKTIQNQKSVQSNILNQISLNLTKFLSSISAENKSSQPVQFDIDISLPSQIEPLINIIYSHTRTPSTPLPPITQTQPFSNYVSSFQLIRYSPSYTLINGQQDFCHIYISHIVQNDQLTLYVHVINTQPFKIDQLSVKAFYSPKMCQYSSNSVQTIEELMSNQESLLVFKVPVLCISSGWVTLDVECENLKDYAVKLMTQPYRVTVLNFALPNLINQLGEQLIQTVINDCGFTKTCQTKHVRNNLIYEVWKNDWLNWGITQTSESVILLGFLYEQVQLVIIYNEGVLEIRSNSASLIEELSEDIEYLKEDLALK